MTFLRKLALSISERVVRWASPGCKEWAEAQARELAFISSDWAALAWALGSTRVLLDRRATSRSEIPAKPSFFDIVRWVLYLAGCIWTCAKMLASAAWTRRLGWGLILLACGYWAACSVFDWLQERWKPSPSNMEPYLLFLRQGLELKLARYSTLRRWLPRLANLSAWVGYMLIGRGQVHYWGYLLVSVWLSLHQPDSPAKIQGRIEQVDAQIARARQTGRAFKRLESDHWGRARTRDADRANEARKAKAW